MPLPRRFAYFNLLDLQDRGLGWKTTRWKRQGRQFGWLIKDLCPRRLQVKRDLIRIRSNERFCGVRSSQGVNPKTYRSRKSHSQKIGRAPWFHWRFVAAMGIRTAMTLCYRGSLGCGELRGHGFPGLPNRSGRPEAAVTNLKSWLKGNLMRVPYTNSRFLRNIVAGNVK